MECCKTQQTISPIFQKHYSIIPPFHYSNRERSELSSLPVEHIWIDFDKEADVLYLSFRKPQRAKETIESDDDILIRRDGNKIVGITILNVSNR